MKPRLVWHYHHRILVELTDEPIRRRNAFIECAKPQEERAERHRRLRCVRGPVPTFIVKAIEALRVAEKVIEKMPDNTLEVTWRQAINRLTHERLALTRALRKKAMLRLHAKECPDCPWDGHTIFPRKARL